MTEYKYDDTGALFNYFFFTVLLLIVGIATHATFKKKSTKVLSINQVCKCHKCDKKKKRRSSKDDGSRTNNFRRYILLTLGWLLLGFFLYEILNTVAEVTQGAYDPYAILEVKEDASLEEISGIRKSLIRKWHPDRAALRGIDPKEAEAKTTQINKAWETISNPEARKNWEEWGNPDGRQSISSGIALPKWLVEEKNMMKVLLSYVGIVVFVLPIYIRKWWKSITNVNVTSLSDKTLTMYVKSIDHKFRAKQFLSLIANSHDFNKVIRFISIDSPDFVDLVKSIKLKMEKEAFEIWNPKEPHNEQNLIPYIVDVYIHAYMVRAPLSNNQMIRNDMKNTINMCLTMLDALTNICISKGSPTPLIECINLTKLMNQAIYLHQPDLLQIPHVNFTDIQRFGSRKSPVTSITELVSIPKDRLEKMTDYLSETEKCEFNDFLKCFPSIEIASANFSVDGESEIPTSSCISLSLDIDIKNIYGEEYPESSDNNMITYLPHTYEDENDTSMCWWILVFYENNRGLIAVTKHKNVTSHKNLKIRIDAPPRPGTYNITVGIVSNCYISADMYEQYKITVVEQKSQEPETSKKPEPKSKSEEFKKQPKDDLEDSESSEEDDKDDLD